MKKHRETGYASVLLNDGAKVVSLATLDGTGIIKVYAGDGGWVIETPKGYVHWRKYLEEAITDAESMADYPARQLTWFAFMSHDDFLRTEVNHEQTEQTEQTEQKEETTVKDAINYELAIQSLEDARERDEARGADEAYYQYLYGHNGDIRNEQKEGETTVYNNVAAIVGDADMYHVNCAKQVYGDEAIDTLIGYTREEVAIFIGTPTDKEGNELTVVFNHSEDLTDETGQPHSCGHCLGYLIEDERPSDMPVVRDIMNLTAEYREEPVTRILSNIAVYLRERGDIGESLDTIIAETDEYRKSHRFQHGEDDIRVSALLTAIRLMNEWKDKYNSREIIHLTNITPGKIGRQSYADDDGNEWEEYDFRDGYLDMYNNGDSECESCGRRIESHCFLDDVETAYCPDCVTID